MNREPRAPTFDEWLAEHFPALKAEIEEWAPEQMVVLDGILAQLHQLREALREAGFEIEAAKRIIARRDRDRMPVPASNDPFLHAARIADQAQIADLAAEIKLLREERDMAVDANRPLVAEVERLRIDNENMNYAIDEVERLREALDNLAEAAHEFVVLAKYEVLESTEADLVAATDDAIKLLGAKS